MERTAEAFRTSWGKVFDAVQIDLDVTRLGFHIVAQMNKALDGIRAGESRRIGERGRRAHAEEVALAAA